MASNFFKGGVSSHVGENPSADTDGSSVFITIEDGFTLYINKLKKHSAVLDGLLGNEKTIDAMREHFEKGLEHVNAIETTFKEVLQEKHEREKRNSINLSN